MNPKILPIVIAIIMSFGNKSALVAQVQLQQYQKENYMNTHEIIISTVRAKTKLPKNSRLVRYYKLNDGKDNRLIFGMIYVDSEYVNSICVNHHVKNTYDEGIRELQRKKSDEILNDYYFFKVYTADNRKFYMEIKDE